MLQTIRRLLIRPECFRLEREFAGPDFYQGEQCTLPGTHTNTVERAIRPVCLSRKNALFASGEDGWARWCAAASLVDTCKLNGVDPQRYFTDVLTRLVNGWPDSRIDEIMPWRWAADKNGPASSKGREGP